MWHQTDEKHYATILRSSIFYLVTDSCTCWAPSLIFIARIETSTYFFKTIFKLYLYTSRLSLCYLIYYKLRPYRRAIILYVLGNGSYSYNESPLVSTTHIHLSLSLSLPLSLSLIPCVTDLTRYKVIASLILTSAVPFSGDC